MNLINFDIYPKRKMFRLIFITFTCLFFVCFSLLRRPQSARSEINIIFSENFNDVTPENWHGWYTDNGIWDIGPPTSGPEDANSPPNCAATVLNGNYPNGSCSTLISPQILLPDVGVNEEILLRFSQFFYYYSGDYGEVQIKFYEDGNWSDWTALKTVDRYAVEWHHARIDLSEYAGKLVRIGFYHYDDAYGSNYVCPGWYIDDVQILKQTIPTYTVPYMEDFDSGWGGWYSDHGIWDLGEPSYGTESAYSPPNCVATVLDSTYPNWPCSTLISPQILLPDATCLEQILLRFRTYYAYYSGDYGEVQIQAYEDGNWSEWSPLIKVNGYVDKWFQKQIDLTGYAGKLVRIGFYHYDDAYGSRYVSAGWYIDDIEIINLLCEGDFDGDLDVDGTDLAIFAADFGRTDCCEPDATPCEGDFDGDCDVDGSDLALFASDFGRSDCPFCPSK